MTTIVTRSGKGSALTFLEGDSNFTNLNNDKIELNNLSVTDSGGDGSLSYNNTSGVFTYVGPSATEVRAHFSAGTGISITDGQITSTVTDTNTTYGISAETTTGGVNLRLSGSDASTDDVKLAEGTNITLTRTDANTITIAAAGGGGGGEVVDDTTPQLGGDLDVNGFSIISASNGNIAITPNGTGKSVISNINYSESPFTLTYASTITPNVTNGNVQIVTLTGNVTFSAFSSPVAGQSLTLIVKQDGTGGRSLTSTMKFAGGIKTLSGLANAVDIISVYYDGTNYWANLSKGYA